MDLAVVIPVRNGGALFAEQLESLCRQDFTGTFEVVVADNGSTDDTGALVERFASRLAVRLVDASQRSGPAHARNVGAAATDAQWIAYCDADDVADPSWLRLLFGARHRGDLVAGQLEARCLNDPDVLQARGFHEVATRLPDGPARFLSYAASANLLIRREALGRIGGWDEDLRYCEDVDLCWRAQLAGLSLVYEPEAVMHYRFRGTAWDMFRQISNYASREPSLFVRYRRHGARRPPWTHLPAQVLWLLSRSPYVVLGGRRRLLWVAVAAEAVGHVRGSVTERVYFA
ncbi:hypothetical protein ASD06_16505 [Angustibacter sp. Root456]|nr:hypothetical protein ASD06_16505 [Angustibacter sp. Root456]